MFLKVKELNNTEQHGLVADLNIQRDRPTFQKQVRTQTIISAVNSYWSQ